MSDRKPNALSVTSFDVARKAGVSRSTVSRAFTPGSNVSKETKRKIDEAASQLGYRVNMVARGLNKQRMDMVGMIASRMSNPHRSAQIDALSKCLVREGFRPMLFCVDGDMDVEHLISILLQHRVSGIVITSDSPPTRICAECAEARVPLVLMDRADKLPFVDHINGDNVKGGRIAADTLIDANRRNLLVLRPQTSVHSVATRIDAFVARARVRGVAAKFLPVTDYDYESGRNAAPDVLRQRDQALGIFCPTDRIALGLLDSLRVRHGVRIPEEMSLIGYDDIPQAAWEFARLTTIRQPAEAFAKAAVNLLKTRIHTPEGAPNNEVVDVSLVRRGTV